MNPAKRAAVAVAAADGGHGNRRRRGRRHPLRRSSEPTSQPQSHLVRWGDKERRSDHVDLPVPVRCKLCGEVYPDNDTLWDHECPEWDRVRKQAMPTLAAHRNLIQLYESGRGPRWARWLVLWGIRHSVPEQENPELIDALLKLGPRYAFRQERKMERRGIVTTKQAENLDRARRQYEIEEETERRLDGDARRARYTVDGRRRAANRPTRNRQRQARTTRGRRDS
jgi:hypothetical protein